MSYSLDRFIVRDVRIQSRTGDANYDLQDHLNKENHAGKIVGMMHVSRVTPEYGGEEFNTYRIVYELGL